jgi:hypothetical protein
MEPHFLTQFSNLTSRYGCIFHRALCRQC